MKKIWLILVGFYFVGSGEITSFSRVSKQIIPAVVNISTTRHVVNSSFLPPGFEDFFDFPFPMSPQETESKALGSGFIISSNGYIVTNYHVVKGYDGIVVKLHDGTTYRDNEVKLIGVDQRSDIAILKIKAKDLPFLSWGNSDSLEIGDWVIAVGNPYGLEGTVTVGVVSARGRSGLPLRDGPVYQDFIQTDASINPGNSGGPLCNIKGEVVGINTAIKSTTGANVGIGFAIPSMWAKKIVNQLINKGKIERGYLGVYLKPLDDDLKEALGVKEGVLIRQVEKSSPADKAGIQSGDIIVQFDGKKVNNIYDLQKFVADVSPGKVVNIRLIRDGKAKIKKVKIGEYTEPIVVKNTQEKWGITARSLKISEKRDMGVNNGIYIEAVDKNSLAYKAGIRKGDVIIKINNYPINSPSELSNVMDKVKNKKVLLFVVLRDGNIYYLTFRR